MIPWIVFDIILSLEESLTLIVEEFRVFMRENLSKIFPLRRRQVFKFCFLEVEEADQDPYKES